MSVGVLQDRSFGAEGNQHHFDRTAVWREGLSFPLYRAKPLRKDVSKAFTLADVVLGVDVDKCLGL